jgi:hypothetical protein
MSLNTGNYPTPASIGKNGITIEQNIESLLTVNGDVDRDVLPDLKTILEKFAEYTRKEITKDMYRAGYRRSY